MNHGYIDFPPFIHHACRLCIILMLSVIVCGCHHSSHESDLPSSASLPYTVYFDLQPQLEQGWIKSSSHLWLDDWGVLAYSEPESYHLDYFYLPQASTKRTGQRNLFGENNYLTLYEGEFEMLIYNNDFDFITVDYSGDEHYIVATTGLDSQSEITEAPDGQEIRYQPDKLLVDHLNLVLTEDTPGCQLDSSSKKYAVTCSCELEPATKLYLICIDLVRNYDRVKGCTAAIVGGLAKGLELYTQQPLDEAVSHTVETHFYNDYLFSRLITFGPCAEQQKMWLWLKYANGYRTVEIDLSGQFALNPYGGVIYVSIDIAADYPEPENTGQSGGMTANVSGWEGEENYYLDI